MVTIRGGSNAQWSFGGFSGDCPVGAGSCTVSMTQDRNAPASYSLMSYTLNMGANTGNGWGTVASDVGGISCSFNTPYGPTLTSCSASIPYGTWVTLTATPIQEGEMYETWPSGCDSVNGTTCQVYVTGARTVAPNFYGDGVDLTVQQLTDSYGALGYGKVTSTPSAMNCGDVLILRGQHAVCKWRYHWSTQVVLHATPTRGTQFSGWIGCDSVNGTDCTVGAYGTRNVTAQFIGLTIP
jgi:hypothetical protein